MAGLIALMLSVTALQASRRRAGMAFSSNETLVDPATVTAEQVEQLIGDPLLSVGLTISEGEERTETVMLSGKSVDHALDLLIDAAAVLRDPDAPVIEQAHPADIGQDHNGQDQGTDLSQPVGGQVADTGAGGLTDPASATQAATSATPPPSAPADTQADAPAPVLADAKPAKQRGGRKAKP